MKLRTQNIGESLDGVRREREREGERERGREGERERGMVMGCHGLGHVQNYSTYPNHTKHPIVARRLECTQWLASSAVLLMMGNWSLNSVVQHCKSSKIIVTSYGTRNVTRSCKIHQHMSQIESQFVAKCLFRT